MVGGNWWFVDGLKCKIVVLISADIEWCTVLDIFPDVAKSGSPYGEYFFTNIEVAGYTMEILYFHGGWGKISAAASTQYIVDRWSPDLLVNLGTCGGLEGEIEKGATILVDKTIVYDIIEQMGDDEDHISHYTTNLDLSWLSKPYPYSVEEGLIVSADRDILPEDIPNLKSRFGARAADWESAAIAFVAVRNEKPCLILRGVSDIVNSKGGEAYGDIGIYQSAAWEIMKNLVRQLPDWLNSAKSII